MQVLLVDGCGRRRQVELPEGGDEFKVPVPQPLRWVHESALLPAPHAVACFRPCGEWHMHITANGVALFPIWRQVL
jgi:hypothetical protein